MADKETIKSKVLVNFKQNGVETHIQILCN